MGQRGEHGDGPTLSSDERVAEGASTSSAPLDVAGVEVLSADESSDSSEDTLVEVPEANNTAAAATTTPPPDEIDIAKVNKQTEEVLEGLFEILERPTRAEQDQDKQKTDTGTGTYTGTLYKQGRHRREDRNNTEQQTQAPVTRRPASQVWAVSKALEIA